MSTVRKQYKTLLSRFYQRQRLVMDAFQGLTVILVTSDGGDHGGDQEGPHWPTDSSESPGPELATSGHTPLASPSHCTQGKLGA